MSISAEITGQGQMPSDGQADGGASSFDFSSLREQALSMLEGTPAGDTPVEQAAPITNEPVVPEEVVAAPEGEATNVDTASASALAQLKDTDLVEVEVDGQKVQMPWAEARGGVMRQAKFTKSMQQVARDREAFEAEKASIATLRQEREAMVTLLQNKDLMQQFLLKQYPELVQQAQAAAATAQSAVDPDDIATVGQIEAVKREAAQQIQSLMNDFQQRLKQERDTITSDIEDRQASAKLGLEVSSTIKGLFKEHPYLEKVIPNAEQILRYEVMNMRPQTPEEVVDAFKTVVGGWVENYKSTVQETTKQQVIQKHKLQSNNIQPPGGAPVQPQAQSFFKKARNGQTEIDWAKLRQAGLDMMGE